MATGRNLDRPASATAVDSFLEQAARLPAKRTPTGGRVIFALDATYSRQPTWDRAAHLQAEMFEAAADAGGLALQLVYFQGFGEFQTSAWTTDARALLKRMSRVQCVAGLTQVGRVLNHALQETGRTPVSALVYVGDSLEERERPLRDLAGQLGLHRVPVFLFHEGDDPDAGRMFAEIARLSGGACVRFDGQSADQLRALLRAVAIYASAGTKALADHARSQGGVVKQITAQMQRSERGGS